MNTFRDVLSGSARWSCECADALAWGASLPNDSIDLLKCSPPYMRARTYGRDDVARDLDEWVAWMVEFVKVFSPKVNGLIAINCEGQTREYRYQPAPFLLAADLHRAGFNLRKPPIFHRVGIPGSGGPDWLRNDYEPIICVTRPGRLPWSDNTACGHPPKWAPDGAMGYRNKDGDRKNAVPKVGSENGDITPRSRKARGEARRKAVEEGRGQKMRVIDSGEWADSTTKREWNYVPPAVTNPGNTLEAKYTAEEVRDLLAHLGIADEALPELLRIKVGGGLMWHPLAHENEAPFPLALPEFFVKSFCPPDGVVCDPFDGSGTTCHAAVVNGRRFIGCDIRESQVDLVRRRMASITPGMFTGLEAA